MTSSIRVDGRTTVVPGSYTTIDRSGLNTPGLGSSGVVAVIGTAEGGRPVTDIDDANDIPTFSRESQVRGYFRSGDLREVASPLLFPSNDIDIPGGAERILFCKTNNATRSQTTLSNSAGAVINIESFDYGEFTNGLAVQLLADDEATGSVIVKVINNGEESVKANVGGAASCSLTYLANAQGYTSMGASVMAGIITATGQKTMTGRQEDAPTGTGVAGVVSLSSTQNDTNLVTLFGTEQGSGNAISETVRLDGTNLVNSTKEFEALFGFEIQQSAFYPSAPGMTQGTVTARAGTQELMAAGPQSVGAGIDVCRNCFVANQAISLTASVAGKVLVVGTAPSGAPVTQVYDLNADVAFLTAESFREVKLVCLTGIPGSENVSFSAIAAQTNPQTQATLGACKTYFDSLGFNLELRDVTYSGALVTTLDNLDDEQDALLPARADFTADNDAVVGALNELPGVVATRVPDAIGGRPEIMTAPQYLSGGGEGSETIASIQKAFDLLRRIDVNSVVLMSYNPAARALLVKHCQEMCGIGRSERDGFCGILNKDAEAGGFQGNATLPTKDFIKQSIQGVDSRHIRAFAQSVFFADSTGVQREFGPAFQAAYAAGAQAGSPVGTALTEKTFAVNAVKQYNGEDGAWNAYDDAEELIRAGLCFFKPRSQGGIVCVRNNTTKLNSADLSQTNAEVNEAVNYAVLNFRRRLQLMVGRRTFAGTATQTKQLAASVLGQLVNEGVVQSWGALEATVEADKVFVEVALQPAFSVNFVKSVIYLTTGEVA